MNNLAGVPSIVFGVFGLGFFVYFVGGTIDQLFFGDYLPTPTFGTGGILWASLTLALMTVPVVIVATEESIAAVPRGMREGSLACGASKWQTIQRIVLPARVPGILTGLILAMARGAGEVAPLMLVGVVKLAPEPAARRRSSRSSISSGSSCTSAFTSTISAFSHPISEAAKPMVFATTLLLIWPCRAFESRGDPPPRAPAPKITARARSSHPMITDPQSEGMSDPKELPSTSEQLATDDGSPRPDFIKIANFSFCYGSKQALFDISLDIP